MKENSILYKMSILLAISSTKKMQFSYSLNHKNRNFEKLDKSFQKTKFAKMTNISVLKKI